MRTRLLLTAALLVAVQLSAQARVQRPMTFGDFAAVKNVGDPQVSPDGRSVLYTVRTTDVDANKRTTVTMLAPVLLSGNLATRMGFTGRGIQFPNASTQATEARWSPDGKRVAYIAKGQLWIADANGAKGPQECDSNGGAG